MDNCQKDLFSWHVLIAASQGSSARCFLPCCDDHRSAGEGGELQQMVIIHPPASFPITLVLKSGLGAPGEHSKMMVDPVDQHLLGKSVFPNTFQCLGSEPQGLELSLKHTRSHRDSLLESCKVVKRTIIYFVLC